MKCTGHILPWNQNKIRNKERNIYAKKINSFAWANITHICLRHWSERRLCVCVCVYQYTVRSSDQYWLLAGVSGSMGGWQPSIWPLHMACFYGCHENLQLLPSGRISTSQWEWRCRRTPESPQACLLITERFPKRGWCLLVQNSQPCSLGVFSELFSPRSRCF